MGRGVRQDGFTKGPAERSVLFPPGGDPLKESESTWSSNLEYPQGGGKRRLKIRNFKQIQFLVLPARRDILPEMPGVGIYLGFKSKFAVRPLNMPTTWGG